MFRGFIELSRFPHKRNIQLATSVKRVEENVKGQSVLEDVLKDASCCRVLCVTEACRCNDTSQVDRCLSEAFQGSWRFRDSGSHFAAVRIEREVDIDLRTLLDRGLHLKSSPEAFDCIPGEKDAKAHPLAGFLRGEKWFA